MVVGVILPSYELNDLFEAPGVWRKLESGQLLETREGAPVPAKADWCRDGVSYFTRLSNSAGFEVGRLHYLVCSDGTVARWPSFLTLGNVRLRRYGHQPRPD